MEWMEYGEFSTFIYPDLRVDEQVVGILLTPKYFAIHAVRPILPCSGVLDF